MDRMEIIKPYIEGKEILDIGCVDHSIESMQNKSRVGKWLHEFLKKHAESLLGIDIREDGLEEMKRLGYDVTQMDAEKIDINRKFDVITAGELIEHLSNQGLFLDGCRKHIKPNGLLILTTPNAFSLGRWVKFWWQFPDPTVNDEHVLWHSPKTMKQLLDRHGFVIEKIRFSDDGIGILKTISSIGLERLASTMVVIARRK